MAAKQEQLSNANNECRGDSPGGVQVEEKTVVDEMTSRDLYSDPYAHFNVHEEMLKDEVRTLTYRDAIYQNKHLFKDKVVLEVGCGTCILSMFAAKAGATVIFAVDTSKIISYAHKIVVDNKMENVIKVIEGKIEEIELPGHNKVDIIISDWMGYTLFEESMLDTVIAARDKWLKSDGMMFTDHVSLYIAAIQNRTYKENKINWLNNVYGFNMSCIKKMVISEPVIVLVDPENIVTDSYLLKKVDLYKIKKEDMEFSSLFRLVVKRSDSVYALLTYFDVKFTKCHKLLKFSTAPPICTHWKQTVFFLDEGIAVKKDEQIYGKFKIKRHQPDSKNFDFEIDAIFTYVREHNEYNFSFNIMKRDLTRHTNI